MNTSLSSYIFVCLSLISCAAHGAYNQQTAGLCELSQKYADEITASKSKISSLQPALDDARNKLEDTNVLYQQRKSAQMAARDAWKKDPTNNNLLNAMLECEKEYQGAVQLELNYRRDFEAIKEQINGYTDDINATQGLLFLTLKLSSSQEHTRIKTMHKALIKQISEWDEIIKELETFF